MISVLLTAYNAERYIRLAIESILGQTYTDFELIIVDDCSTDSTYETACSYRDPRIRFHKNSENLGHTKSMNIAMRMGKGEYFAWQDADDISLPERFEKQVNLFTGKIGLVTTWGISIDDRGRKISNWYTDEAQRKPEKEILDNILKDCWILGPSAMWTQEVVDKIGYFDEEMYLACDYNYWLRLLKHFEFKTVKEVLYKYRKHDESVRKLYKEKMDWLKLCQKRAKECLRIR